MRPTRTLVVTLLWVLLLPWVAQGQDQVRIIGHVIADDTEEPLSDAQISLRRVDGTFLTRTETDSLGAFELIVHRQSAVQVRAERMGYKTNSSAVLHFDGHRLIQVVIRLDTEAIVLAPIEVIVWYDVDPSPLLDGFRHRKDTGMGTFITRSEIESRRPMYLSDVLRSVPGVEVSSEGRGNRPVIHMGRSLGRRCSPQVFVDGMLANRPSTTGGPGGFRIDDVVSPGAVEAIEIYRGLSSIPPEFLNPDAQCGVIAVWTRRGGTVGN
ncbi:MAG: TonB-dependent receptor [Gemmatimonadota bacterium]|nr:TonB-dependent receptor [Gemmatimonadota bacterium]